MSVNFCGSFHHIWPVAHPILLPLTVCRCGTFSITIVSAQSSPAHTRSTQLLKVHLTSLIPRLFCEWEQGSHFTSHDITWSDIVSHDITWHHMTSHDHHMVSYDITWPHYITPHDITSVTSLNSKSPLQPISSSLPFQPSSAAACSGHWTAGSAETGHTPWDQIQHYTESPTSCGGCTVLSVLQPACHCMRGGGECWISWITC